MDKLIVIKNGLVLTLDRNKSAGFYNIIIRNGKFTLIDKEKKFSEKDFLSKYPDAEIVNAENKLVFPGFFNSRLNSSFTFNKLFFKKCSYENINSWLSLKSIDRFLSAKENVNFFYELLNLNYHLSLSNGEILVCENSTSVSEDFFKSKMADRDWIKQYYNLVLYNYSFIPENLADEKFISVGFKAEEEINNYSLSSMKKALSEKSMKLFIEASLSAKTLEAIKKDFGKGFVGVLIDMEMISSNSIIVSPLRLSTAEIEILKKKNASVLVCPSDYLNLSDKKLDLEELFFSGIRIIIGTGYTGSNILSELKTLSYLMDKSSFNYESLIDTAVRNPSMFFGISNVTGSIERNKSADFVLFNLDDLRNRLTIPELDSELLCEFLVHNLSVKDISDVFIKGERLVKEYKIVNPSETVNPIKMTETANRIYMEGKYFEFKEKYLMRSRVDSINIENKESEFTKPEIFVDYTDTSEIYLGEGEFTIKGKKEEEFEKERIEEKSDELIPREISSIDEGLNLLEDLDSDQNDLPEIVTGKKIPSQDKIIEKSKSNISRIKTDSESENESKQDEEENESGKIVSEDESTDSEDEKVVFKKSKLQFGFGDEGKK